MKKTTFNIILGVVLYVIGGTAFINYALTNFHKVMEIESQWVKAFIVYFIFLLLVEYSNSLIEQIKKLGK